MKGKKNNGRKVSYAQKGLGVRPKHLLLSYVRLMISKASEQNTDEERSKPL